VDIVSRVTVSIAVLSVIGIWGNPSSAAPLDVPTDAAGVNSDYQQWIDRYAPRSFSGYCIKKREQTDFQLVVTAVIGDGKDDGEEDRLLQDRLVVFGLELTVDGHVQYFSRSSFSHKGGGGGEPIPQADMKRLAELLERLPDDGGTLPPAERKLLVSTPLGGSQVYDRANAPDEVWEVLRLARSNIRSWVPLFEVDSRIDASNHQHGGFFCLSPDGEKILFTSANGPLQFWDTTTHELLAESQSKSGLGKDLVFSANGELMAVGGGWGECIVYETKSWQPILGFSEPMIDGKRFGLIAPRFLQDGRYLLMHISEPALRFADVETGERLDGLPKVPEDAVQFFPSPTERLAVVRMNSDRVLLWDVDAKHQLAELERGCSLSEVSFAPDENLVAIVTNKLEEGQTRTTLRVRIWDATTGQELHELRPFQLATIEHLEGIVWTPDGRYCLLVTKSDSFFSTRGISVFNAETGRHCGEFAGGGTRVKGIAILPEQGRLAAGFDDGKIRFWNLEDGLKQIASFEDSLTEL